MHELPQLGKLERAFPGQVAVIGVHSCKYPAEGDPENVRDAVERYGVSHPVVTDPDHQIWDAYAVKAWPTLVFVSPAGNVIGSHSGEVQFAALEKVVTDLIAEYGREGEGSLWSRPFRGPIGSASRGGANLRFPGKVLGTERALFVADSGNHRILVAHRDGVVQTVAGNGDAGLMDGPFESARFRNPQGMAFDEKSGVLYVADADNHVIRTLDLATRRVTTVAGTGEQAYRIARGGSALETRLSSPWDLALRDGTLYIAMAGLHQIWTLDPERATLAVWAGTGHEALKDGPRTEAWLAQPMGLSLSDESLYVSCAEAQSVRRIDLANGEVTTLVGSGLFAFGDEDGAAADALLQHNQDVEWGAGAIYVADTYNNKVKVMSPNERRVTTFAGSGRRGVLDGPGTAARFSQPAGMSVHNGILYVADTNNHLVRACDIPSGIVQTVRFTGLTSSG